MSTLKKPGVSGEVGKVEVKVLLFDSLTQLQEGYATLKCEEKIFSIFAVLLEDKGNAEVRPPT